MVLITIVTGVYKPTYNWGAPPCIYIYIHRFGIQRIFTSFPGPLTMPPVGTVKERRSWTPLFLGAMGVLGFFGARGVGGSGVEKLESNGSLSMSSHFMGQLSWL